MTERTRGALARTTGAARYLAAELVRTQRALVPLIVFAGVVAVLFGGDPGALPTPWAVTTLAVYPVAAWLALLVANAQDPAARLVTVAAAGGTGRVVGATLLVALAGDVLLVGLAVGPGLVLTHHPWSAGAAAAGLAAHAAAATTGTAVGLLVARPLVTRAGWSFCLGAVIVVVTAVQPWLPPVGATVEALVATGRAPAVEAVSGLVLAVVAAVVVWAVDRRS